MDAWLERLAATTRPPFVRPGDEGMARTTPGNIQPWVQPSPPAFRRQKPPGVAPRLPAPIAAWRLDAPTPSARKRTALALLMGPNCHYCGVLLTPVTATLDHIVPASMGGCSDLWNLVLACSPCNTALGATTGKCDCDRCEDAYDTPILIRRSPTKATSDDFRWFVSFSAART